MSNVSIIIPVYNKENNLSECLDSIFNQIYKNFEIICIDDCSEDGSRAILNEYEKKDKRLKIIYNEKNEGAAAARNKGIEYATGEYILILDADDIFDEDLILITYGKCKQEDLDILVYDYRRMDNITKKKTECFMPLPMQKKIGNKIFSAGEIKDFSFQMCLAAPWVKMYRRQFVLESRIRFQDLSSSNDGAFGRTILLLKGRFFYLDKDFVTYRVNTQNQISKIDDNSILNFIYALKKMKNIMEERDIFEKNKKSFCSYVLSVTIGYLIRMDQIIATKYYYNIINNLNDILGQDPIFLNNYYKYIFQDMKCQVHVENYLSQWNEYDYLFRYENKKLIQLNKYLESLGKKVALWGYGYSGKEFFKRSRMINTQIDLIVDENYMNINSVLVKKPDYIAEDNYIVLVTMASYGKSILERAVGINRNIILIDLQSYFTYGFDLKDCIFDEMYLTEGWRN